MNREYNSDEMMTIAASRALSNSDVCFVGIGAPSAACNIARMTHAPDITLIYESGTIGTAPNILPLSIGDGELCETAITTVAVPEMFRYWLQGGRITSGFLGAAQLDKFGNINTAKNVHLQSIDRSELLFGNNFDDESINISLIKSENSVDYNFLMSNVISKLLSSS